MDTKVVWMGPPVSSIILKEETEQDPSWKQDSILGRTVDFELYAQYLWKWHTNWKTRPPKEEPQGSYLRLSSA